MPAPQGGQKQCNMHDEPLHTRTRAASSPNRHGLTLLLATSLVGWILAGPHNTTWQAFGSIILATLTLGSAAWTARLRRTTVRIIVGGILLINVLIALLGYGTPIGQTLQSTLLLTTAVITPWLIVRALAHHRRIDLQMLLGAITIYLFVGITFGTAFAITARAQSDPLLVTAAGATDGAFADQLYFSFVTLSTTGYGDFAPLSGTARALALLESLGGQLYLVVAVAAIVSLLVSKPSQPSDAHTQDAPPAS